MNTTLYKTLSVLIVDNDLQYMLKLKEVLDSCFGFVYYTQSGFDGLDIMKKYNPDIVLSDIDISYMSGMEMLEEIKNINQRSICIITTEYEDTKYLVEAIDIRVDAYLFKPLSISKLFEKIDKLLQNREDENLLFKQNKPVVYETLHKKLSKREYEVFLDVVKGVKPNDIAVKYDVKPKTISTYRRRVLEKMGMNNNAELIRYSIENNIF